VAIVVLDMPRTLPRRHLLASVGGALATLSGCTGPTVTDDESAQSTGDSVRSPTATGQSGDASQSATGTPELDLQEANVVGVEVAAEDSQHRFDVTLYHDDDGEDGYANWWQVETLGGEQLGRRELLHAHSTAPFTRSETVEVPEGTACVIVRGHDQTHGYGGQVMVVALPSGATRAIQQGPEKASVADEPCP